MNIFLNEMKYFIIIDYYYYYIIIIIIFRTGPVTVQATV